MNRIIKDVFSIKSVQRTLGVFAFLSILTMAVPVATFTASAAQANNNRPCLTRAIANGNIVERNGYAVATFRVPQSCKVKQQVSLAVYKINDGIWQNSYKNQYLYSSRTHWFGPGMHQLSAPLPNCAWQADLGKGLPSNLAQGEKPAYGLGGAKVGGNKVPCKTTPKPPAPKPPTPTPPATTITNTNNNNNVNNVNVEVGGTTSDTTTSEGEVVATESVSSGKDGYPTELANTGPGGVIAAFVGFSTLGSLAYRMFIGRRLGADL